MTIADHLTSIGYSITAENFDRFVKLSAVGRKGKFGLAYQRDMSGGFEHAMVALHNCILEEEGLAPLTKTERAKKAKEDPIIADGFGSSWSKRCPTCEKLTMEVVRPGKAQCGKCG